MDDKTYNKLSKKKLITLDTEVLRDTPVKEFQYIDLIKKMYTIM